MFTMAHPNGNYGHKLNLSEESTMYNCDKRPSCNMTWENEGIQHKKSLELYSKKEHSKGNHYQVDQRSYRIHFFSQKTPKFITLWDTFTWLFFNTLYFDVNSELIQNITKEQAYILACKQF